MTPDVSIIISTYNRLWSLPRVVNSCRNTKCNTQIIVIDDGSSDGTWEWLKDQTDITPIRQHNQGQTYAINNGMSIARGEYIRFLDSDDFLEPGTIDKQFEKAQLESADLVYGRVDKFIEETQEIRKNPDVPLWDDFLEIQLGSGYGSHFLGMLFHRKLVEQVPRRPDFALREDRMFLLEVGLLFPRIAKTDGCMGYWVAHSSQMQGNYFGFKAQVTNWQHLNIFKKILGQLAAINELTDKRKTAACSVLWPLAHWIAKDHLREAIDLVEWIYELDSGFKVPEKGMLGLLYKKAGFKKTEQLLKLRRILKPGWI